MFCPGESELHSKVGMEPVEHTLTQWAMEYAADKFEFLVRIAQCIAMSEEEGFAVQL